MAELRLIALGPIGQIALELDLRWLDLNDGQTQAMRQALRTFERSCTAIVTQVEDPPPLALAEIGEAPPVPEDDGAPIGAAILGSAGSSTGRHAAGSPWRRSPNPIDSEDDLEGFASVEALLPRRRSGPGLHRSTRNGGHSARPPARGA